jgi:hypothetical protein
MPPRKIITVVGTETRRLFLITLWHSRIPFSPIEKFYRRLNGIKFAAPVIENYGKAERGEF